MACATSYRSWIGRRLSNEPHEAPLERGQHAAKVVAPLEHCAMLANQSERPLLQPKPGALLDSNFRPLAMATEGGEHCDLGFDAKRIITPVTGGDHPAVKVEDARKFPSIKGGDWAP